MNFELSPIGAYLAISHPLADPTTDADGGTSEIHRSMIAERNWSLPRTRT